MKKLAFIFISFLGLSLALSAQQNLEFYNHSTIAGFPNAEPAYLVEDQGGNVWISFPGIGVMKLNPETDVFQIFDDMNSTLPDVSTKKITLDPSTGFIWVGHDAGVSYFNGTTWNTLNAASLAGPQVTDIYIETNGTKWLICNDPNDVNKGLTKVDASNANITNYTLANTPAMITDELSIVRKDLASGNIYIGTAEDGLLVFNPTANTWTQIFSGNSSLNGDQITALVITAAGEKFVGVRNPVAGTYNGLDKINAANTTITNYNQANTSNGLFDDKVADLAFDLAGNLWIASDTAASVYTPSSNTWGTHYRNDTFFGLPNTEVISQVFIDSDGRKWFTTVNHGVIRLGCESGTTTMQINVTNQTNVSCFGENDGSLTIAIFNGTGPYKYRWSNNAPNSNIVTNLPKGNIDVKVTDATGCAVSKTFTITEPAEIVANATKSGFVLTADDAGNGATYSWINCDDNTAQGTGKTYTATQNGNYAVVVTVAGCSDTSSCLTISGIGVKENNIHFSVFPNPATDVLNIEGVKKTIDLVTVLDVTGKAVFQANNITGNYSIPVENLNNGVYILKIQMGDKTSFQKFVKK